MNTAQESIDVTISTAASKATYTGAWATIASWFLSSEFGVLVGVVLGVAGLLVNWYYRSRHDRRQQERHEMLLEQIRAGRVPVDTQT